MWALAYKLDNAERPGESPACIILSGAPECLVTPSPGIQGTWKAIGMYSRYVLVTLATWGKSTLETPLLSERKSQGNGM